MVGLLILKHLRNISDASVVAQFGENAYYQYFCGMDSFTTAFNFKRAMRLFLRLIEMVAKWLFQHVEINCGLVQRPSVVAYQEKLGF